ncbi:hydrocephalus-inducing protein [Phthorimaea operculella]|nr:hydrocephalus-inducing protein [Phthorimaea operculella]
MIRPLVLLYGSATGMSLCLSQNSLQFSRVRKRGCKKLKVMLYNKGDFGAHQNSLQFGRVRKRGCKKLKVMLYNKGDFGAQFCWQALKSESDFTIEPMQGTVAARQNITFTISFRPQNYNPFVKIWAICNIENYKPLELSIYAACVDMGIPQTQSIYIECPVRERKTEYIAITNPTDENWYILSEFSEETPSFETLREFTIDANSEFQIPIHFKPRTFGTHEAQVLFSPIGESALFVTLIGAAMHPNPNAVMDVTVEAKKSHTETLAVYNITEKPELYIVATELIKVVPEKFDGYYEIKFPDMVRVWGEAQGTCLWTFICYEECQMNLRVMFVNEETREYQFYEINVKVTPSTIVDTIRFTCRARESTQKELDIYNPLSKDCSFNVVGGKLHCDETVHVARQSVGKLILTYSPLVVGEFEDILTVDNYLIGTYTYKIIAVCLPAKEKTLEYSAPLGSSNPIRLRICNKSDKHASFVATTNHPSIQLEKNYDLGAFERGKFLVWFEPTELGHQQARVVFSSDLAGEFVFNLNLTATEPKPQGPFDVKAGSYTFVKFKNVFDETHTFRIFVDREEFSVKTQIEQIKSKREIKIQVFLSGSRSWKEPPAGCLNIENFDPAEPKVHWTYYLQGVL